MRKPAVCNCENKDADLLRDNCADDLCLYFRYIDGTIPLLPNPNFEAFNHLLWLFRPVFVEIGQKHRRQIFSSLC